MFIPEFGAFKLFGVTGTLVRNEFDYSSFEMLLTLPSGTDISHATPEFTLYSATDKVYIGDTEKVSGI
jgi:hypothetical protein